MPHVKTEEHFNFCERCFAPFTVQSCRDTLLNIGVCFDDNMFYKFSVLGTSSKRKRGAVSIIEGRKIQHHEINRTLSWPSLESRRKYQICLQIFKCLNGLVPAYLLHDFHYSRDFHPYNTRNKDLLRLPLAKTTKYQTSFRYNGDIAWNDLPYKLRIENSISKFKKGLKLHFCSPKSNNRD